MKKIIGIIFLVFCVSGCLTNPRISRSLASGVIGCHPSEIIIENETAAAWPEALHNFDAICKGERYICSYQPTTGINCRKERK